MASKGKEASRGEMRRRHEAIIRSGALRGLRSEGRMVFVLALCWADYKTCQFRMSARGAASVAGVQPTAVRRGLAQLVEHGIVEVGPKEEGRRQRYRFSTPPKERAQGVSGGDTLCARPRTHGVSPPDTQCARAGHTPCPARAHGVSGARTGCAPYSSIVLKGSSRTREGSALTGRTGPVGPAVRLAAATTDDSEAAT